MRNWLLRLFPAFRTLQAERDQLAASLQEITTEKLILQDRLDGVLEDRGKLWELVRECISNERTAYQLHVNIAMQKQGMNPPWPDAPHLPPNGVPQPQEPIGRREFPSQRVARKTSEFIAAMTQPGE